jgi:putative heme-binding domain-containing protein
MSDFVRDKAKPEAVRLAALETLARQRTDIAVEYLEEFMNKPGDMTAPAAARMLGVVSAVSKPDKESGLALDALKKKLAAGVSPELAAAIVEALAQSQPGCNHLLGLKEKKTFPADTDAAAGILLRNSPFRGVPEKAKTLFPAAAKMDLNKLPSPAALARIGGDKGNGMKVYLASFKGEAQCMKCHKVKNEGGDIGPDLSLIGKKGSKENLFESILMPSKAIADQYANWKVDTEDGASVTGLLVKETPTEWTIRDANGKDTVLPVKGSVKKKSDKSLMPDDIAKSLTEQELIDLVEYLGTLRE